jgi:hypothetical protein
MLEIAVTDAKAALRELPHLVLDAQSSRQNLSASQHELYTLVQSAKTTPRRPRTSPRLPSKGRDGVSKFVE